MGKGIVQIRKGIASLWTSTNTLLKDGEFGYDKTNKRFKVGDGVTTWTTLPYSTTIVGSTVGAPSNATGVDGDWLLDGTNRNLYGPKAAGAWPAAIPFGEKGWSPILAVVTDGARRVYQIVDWTGGAGTKPSTTNQFIGAAGIVSSAPAAQDIRGPAGANGADGAAGTNGQGVPTGGSVGQFLRKIDGTNYNTQWASPLITELTAAATARFFGRITAGGGAGEELTGTQATTLLDLATASLKGLLSPADKKVIDSLHYDAYADFGLVGNDSTDNLAAWTAMKTALPVGARVFYPSGTYRMSGECTMDVDKRISQYGAGRYNSIIKTTSATANIFNISIPAWYNTFTDLGFQSSVTKTAGYAIAVTSGSAVGTNTYRCWATGIAAIDMTGTQSGNLSVHNDWDISAIPNGQRGIRINGSVINTMLHNITMNGGAATTSACLEIAASGAVQVTNCDWIQGTNVILFNATAALGAQACYFTNCFFDQPQADVVTVLGGFTHGRIKFTQCGIAPTGNNNAINIAGTGAGAVGTATALPAGISVVDCDIYSSNGTNTGAGIRVNGCQDINIQSTRITGFNGAGTGAGIRITPSASNVTKVRINGCIIGPNSNLTVTNNLAIWIEAGASALATLSITDNTLIGNTQPLLDSSTVVNTTMKNITGNTGLPQGMSARATVGATVLTTVDTVVMSMPLAPNSLAVGTTFLVDYIDTSSVTNAATVRFRIGTAGTTADAGVLAMTAAATATSLSGRWVVTITAIGASATFRAGGIANATPTAITANSVAFNSTVATFLTMSIASGASATRTVQGGVIQCPA